METELSRQGLRLLLALALGAGLGLSYDVLRPPRRRGGQVLGAALDILFCAAAGWAVFAYAMGAENGRLGVWELAAVLAGFLLYMNTLSPGVLKLLTGLLELLCAAASALRHFFRRLLVLTEKGLAAMGQYLRGLRRQKDTSGPQSPGEEG